MTALASSVAGCSALQPGSDDDARSPEPDANTNDGRATPSADTSRGRTLSPQVRDQLDRLHRATAGYASIDETRADGFQLLGPYMAGMGWHLIHDGRFERAARNGFELTEPPMVTYVRTDDGPRLGAVEYAAPAEAVPESPDLFADGDRGGPSWHTHEGATHVFATLDGRRTDPDALSVDALTTNDNWSEFRPADDQLAAGDAVALDWGSTNGKTGDRTERIADRVITHPDLRTLHVWVHQDNPDGVFHRTNDRFGESSHGHGHGDGGGHHDG